MRAFRIKWRRQAPSGSSVPSPWRAGRRMLSAEEPDRQFDVTIQAHTRSPEGQQQEERFVDVIVVTHHLGIVHDVDKMAG